MIVDLNSTLKKLQVICYRLPVAGSRLLLFFVLGLSSSVTVRAQGEGEIEKVEIEIVKNREASVPQAIRNFEKIPPRPVEPIKPEITYQFKNLSFNVPNFNPVIHPLPLKTKSTSKISRDYLPPTLGNSAPSYPQT